MPATRKAVRSLQLVSKEGNIVDKSSAPRPSITERLRTGKVKEAPFHPNVMRLL